ncbi:MAG: hypothetical protein COB67_08790, partial [SAR324 cluster bacterium]
FLTKTKSLQFYPESTEQTKLTAPPLLILNQLSQTLPISFHRSHQGRNSIFTYRRDQNIKKT